MYEVVQQDSISLKNSTLSYKIFGDGPNVILAFHGFALDSDLFQDYLQAFPDATIYSFDLFFHGESIWGNKDKPLSPEFWDQLMEAFIRKHSIVGFSLLSYSIGSKFAFTTLRQFPEFVENAWFIAPDGPENNFWYSLATGTWPVRAYFKSAVDKPKAYFAVARFLEKAGLINPSVQRFADAQMQSWGNRNRVYHSWVVFRKMFSYAKVVASKVNQHQIPVTFILGGHDRLVTKERLHYLTARLYHYDIVSLDAGHNQLIKEAVHYLKSQRQDITP